MTRSILLLVAIAVLMMSCVGKEPEPYTEIEDFSTPLPVELQGVWAAPDCELVQTGHFAILYERLDQKLASSIIGFARKADSLICEVRGVAILDTINRTVAVEAKDLLHGGEIIAELDSSAQIELLREPFTLVVGDGFLRLDAGGDSLEALNFNDSTLWFRSPTGKSYRMQLVEKFGVVEPYRMPLATSANVARCLQEWELGSRTQTQQNDATISLEINTNEHSYVFYFGGMIYCRAARIRSNEHGTLFAQNIRMMWKPGEFTAAMPENNLAESRAELVIQDSLFDPNICIFAEEGIYWSLKSVSDSVIVVNGCGEDYFRRLPDTAATNRVEWIAYRPYGGRTLHD